MQRSNCGGAWNGNELVRCLKFPWRKTRRVRLGREKREEVSKLHMGGEKEASIRVRDGGWEHQGAEREKAEAVALLCAAVSEVRRGASNL